MAGLPRGAVRQAGEGPAERLVVGVDGEKATFQDMTEMFDSKKDREKLPIKRAILLLRGS